MWKAHHLLTPLFIRPIIHTHDKHRQKYRPPTSVPARIMVSKTVASLSFGRLFVLAAAVLLLSSWPGALARHHKPKPSDLARTARWLMHESTWGVLSTLSTSTGAPFGTWTRSIGRSFCRLSPRCPTFC